MERLSVPKLSHQQIALLTVLSNRRLKGSEARKVLSRYGMKQSLAAFYILAGKLEDKNLIEGHYEIRLSETGRTLKERSYQITAAGLEALTVSRTWYDEIFSQSKATKPT